MTAASYNRNDKRAPARYWYVILGLLQCVLYCVEQEREYSVESVLSEVTGSTPRTNTVRAVAIVAVDSGDATQY